MTIETTQSATPTTETPAATPAEQQPAAPAAQEAAPAKEESFDERLHRIKTSDAAPTKTEKKPEPTVQGAPTEDAEVTKAREERTARLRALQERERAAVDRQAAKKARESAQPPPPDPQIQERLKQLDTYEAALKDEVALLDFAEARGMDATKIGNWIRDRITNPERIAAETAKRAFSPLEEKLLARVDQVEAKLTAREKADEEAKQDAEANSMAKDFVGYVQQHARLAPLSARFLEKNGEEEFLRFANSVAHSIPEASGAQTLHDALEATLERLQLATASAPSQAKQADPSATAKAPTTTVTNSLASQRTVMADEEARFGLLPYEERESAWRKRHGV